MKEGFAVIAIDHSQILRKGQNQDSGRSTPQQTILLAHRDGYRQS